ncbi:hypothetical protein DICA3_B15214 [Diutina catenulata]
MVDIKSETNQDSSWIDADSKKTMDDVNCTTASDVEATSSEEDSVSCSSATPPSSPASEDSVVATLTENIHKGPAIDSFPLRIVLANPATAQITSLVAAKRQLRLSKTGSISGPRYLVRHMQSQLAAASVSFRVDSLVHSVIPGWVYLKHVDYVKLGANSKTPVIFTSDEPDPLGLFQSLQALVAHRSLYEVRVSHHETVGFAIAKFGCAEDAEMIISKYNRHLQGPWSREGNQHTTHHYTLRREFTVASYPRTLAPMATAPSDTVGTQAANDFSVVVLENLARFWPVEDVAPHHLQHLVGKLNTYGDIESAYFPVSADSRICIGFVKYRVTSHTHMQVLTLIRQLSGLSWTQYLTKTRGEVEDTLNGIQINVAQHKHNSLLQETASNFFLNYSSSAGFTVHYPNPGWVQASFWRAHNFQETNVYVVNLPEVFEDNDDRWYEFWSQFGDINSAKIIKQRASGRGRIGFVFYKERTMALDAILATNKQLVTIPGHAPVIIHANWANQKRCGNDKDTRLQDTTWTGPSIPVMVAIGGDYAAAPSLLIGSVLRPGMIYCIDKGHL